MLEVKVKGQKGGLTQLGEKLISHYAWTGQWRKMIKALIRKE